MEKVYSKGFNGWSQLAILLGLVGGGILIGGLVSIPIWTTMTNGSIVNMAEDIMKPENATAAQLVQVVSVLFMFFLPAICFAFICYKNGWTFLGFGKTLDSRLLLIVLLIVACSIPSIGLLEQVNRAIPLPAGTRARFDAMEKQYNAQVVAMVQLKSWGQYFVSLLIIAVLPAITEELIFRGTLQNLLSRWTKWPWLSIIFTSLLFSAIHMSWYGFIARFALGVILGTIFYYTRNIWLNIMAHFINNALVVTMLFAVVRSGKPVDMTASDNFPMALGILALLLLIGLLVWLIKKSPKRMAGEEDLKVFDRSNPFDERDILRD
ncbi:MAG: CPBP family intramembrane glutamic endopeptidase [Chitinophagaceae bacterium]